MPSIRSKLIHWALKAVRFNKKFKSKQAYALALEDSSHSRDALPPPNTSSLIATRVLDGSVIELASPSSKSNLRIMYLHGGCYTAGIDAIHWNFLKQLIQLTHCSITVPLYGLAPKCNAQVAHEFIGRICSKTEQTSENESLVFMGDSAGAGLALAVTQELKRKNLPLPKALFLLSPWLDVSMQNPNLVDDDAILGIAGLKLAGALWAAPLTVDSPLVSPMFGSLQSLPPLYLYSGTNDLLHPDSQKFVSLLKAAGGTCHFTEAADMLHDYMLLPIPEAALCIKDIAAKLMTLT
jgi:epsilon-lactone hydrolase